MGQLLAAPPRPPRLSAPEDVAAGRALSLRPAPRPARLRLSAAARAGRGEATNFVTIDLGQSDSPKHTLRRTQGRAGLAGRGRVAASRCDDDHPERDAMATPCITWTRFLLGSSEGVAQPAHPAQAQPPANGVNFLQCGVFGTGSAGPPAVTRRRARLI